MFTTTFFYSIILLIVCALPISVTTAFYIHNKKPVYLHLTLLFLCYLIELVEIHFITFFRFSPETQLETGQITFPILRIMTSLVILLLDQWILFALMNKKWKVQNLLSLLPLLVLSAFLLTRPQTYSTIWCFYSIRQFYRLIYCIYFFWIFFREKNPEHKMRLKQYLFPILGIFILNCSILLEDSLVISHLNFFMKDLPIFTERNFSENALWVFISLYTFFYLCGKLRTEFSPNYSPENLTSPETILSEPTVPFSTKKPTASSEHMLQRISVYTEYYKFTPREEEILKCIIEKKSVSEISKELYISLGTVKAHTHNIYSKANVTGRNELLEELKKL